MQKSSDDVRTSLKGRNGNGGSADVYLWTLMFEMGIAEFIRQVSGVVVLVFVLLWAERDTQTLTDTHCTYCEADLIVPHMQMITRGDAQNHPDGELLASPQNKSCVVLQVSHESLCAAVCGFSARYNVGFVFGSGTIALIVTVIT